MATAFAGAGFTGSYIFSQTIFTMRSGVHSRINGFVIALLMLAIFVAPVSVIDFLPSYFFGSLMIWIGWEIARVRALSAVDIISPVLMSCLTGILTA